MKFLGILRLCYGKQRSRGKSAPYILGNRGWAYRLERSCLACFFIAMPTWTTVNQYVSLGQDIGGVLFEEVAKLVACL